MLSAAPLDNDASSQFVLLLFIDPVDVLFVIVCADVLKLSAQD